MKFINEKIEINNQTQAEEVAENADAPKAEAAPAAEAAAPVQDAE